MPTPFKNKFRQLFLIPAMLLPLFSMESQSAEPVWKPLGLAGGGVSA